VGTPFRLHGRDAAGLDCVGVAAAAFGAAVPTGYALRSGDLARLEAGLAAAGLVRGDDARAGDLIVLRPGPGQLHLGVWTGDGLVHADASLRRVVLRPGAPPWPVIGRWRRGGE
jgi:hypothetical protein